MGVVHRALAPAALGWEEEAASAEALGAEARHRARARVVVEGEEAPAASGHPADAHRAVLHLTLCLRQMSGDAT